MVFPESMYIPHHLSENCYHTSKRKGIQAIRDLARYARIPKITCNGEIIFEVFYVLSSALYWKLSVSREKIIMNGMTIFTISFSDTYTICNSFTYDGIIRKCPHQWNGMTGGTLPSTIKYSPILLPTFVMFCFLTTKKRDKEYR